MKRLLDVALASLILILATPVMLAVALWIKCVSSGPVIYWSDRVGRRNQLFAMPKFRTMRVGAPQLPTRMLTNADRWIIPGGRFLRSASLDELPQLWTVLRGDMSFVGPRPMLANEYDVLELRIRRDVHQIKPGLTGWAQVNGRDDLGPETKVEFDHYYFENQSLSFDLKIVGLTAFKVLRRDGVAQAGEEAFRPQTIDSPPAIPASQPVEAFRRAA